MKTSILIILTILYSSLTYSQTSFICDSENIKTINTGKLQTVIQNSNTNIWIVNENQTSIKWQYEDNGITNVEIYNIIDSDIPDDLNSVTYSITDKTGWKSLITINLVNRKINWIISKTKNNILKYYYIEFNILKFN